MKSFKAILVSYLLISGFCLFGSRPVSSQEKKQGEVHVASLDFDHALCAYIELKDEEFEDLKEESKVSCSRNKTEPRILTDLFSAELNRLGVSLVLYGSNRQSLGDENFNTKRKGSSSYGPFCDFVKKLKLKLEPILMEDFYREGFFPENFRLFGYQGESLKILTLTMSKIDILYVQMQKVASLFSEQNVVFHFYDDTSGIMSALNIFYSSHLNLIPLNMTLKLHYIGRTSDDFETPLNERTQDNLTTENPWNYNFSEIKGNGEACSDFEELLKNLQRIAEEIKETEIRGLSDPTAGGLVNFLKEKRGIPVEKKVFGKRRGSPKKSTPSGSAKKDCCVIL